MRMCAVWRTRSRSFLLRARYASAPSTSEAVLPRFAVSLRFLTFSRRTSSPSSFILLTLATGFSRSFGTAASTECPWASSLLTTRRLRRWGADTPWTARNARLRPSEAYRRLSVFCRAFEAACRASCASRRMGPSALFGLFSPAGARLNPRQAHSPRPERRGLGLPLSNPVRRRRA